MNLALSDFIRLQSQYPHLAAALLAVVKSSLVIALSCGAAGILRRQSALARNWVWRCAIIGLLGLTFWEFGPAALTRFHPVWHVNPLPQQSMAFTQPLPGEPSDAVSEAAPPTTARTQTTEPQVLAKVALSDIAENNVRTIWWAGIAILLLWRGVRTVAGYWWLNKSASLAGPGLLETARKTSTLAGLKSPPLLAVCGALATPLLTGWIRPSIFLPAEYIQWKDEKLEAVLLHEMAHWQRLDGWWQTLAAFTQSIWWWNPLAWVAVRKLKVEAEQAADEIVVLRQQDAPSYARALVEIAAAAGKQDFSAGIAMVGGSSLEKRIRAILRDNPWRGKLGALAIGAAISLTCIFLVLGAFYLGAGKASAQASPPAASAPPSDALTREMLAAASAGDVNKASTLLRTGDGLGLHAGFQAIQQALSTRDLRAFTTMYDLFQKSPAGRNWKIDDASLASLVKDGRTDFLDALLARGLDLNRLSAQSGAADKTTATWITRRIAEVGKQRADIETLCKAAGAGDLPAIQRLLAAGVDVNSVGKDNNTPLIRAVFKNQLQAAQLLLDHGAQVDKPRFPGWDYTPLCLVNTVPMAELLKKNGANVQARIFSQDVSILSYVVKTAKPDVVAWFLQQGLDPKKMDDEGDGEGSLLFHLENGDVAKLLLDAGVDPNRTNKYGEPPIATARSAAVAQALIDHGARLTGFQKPLLLWMARNQSAGAMEAVLKASADHDPIALQSALNALDFNGGDFHDKDKMRQLLIGYGARPVPASDLPAPEQSFDIAVSATDDEFMGDGGTIINEFSSGSSGSGLQSIKVEWQGTAPVWVRGGTQSLSLAAVRKGWAPAFAGPFQPPFDQKLKDLKLSLNGGAQASVEIVDEQGNPIAGAKLKGYYPGPPRVDCDAIATNNLGTATLEHIGSAPLNLQVSADGYQADEIDSIRFDPAKPYRWTLKKAEITNGIVTDAATGKPIAGATIKLAGVLGPHAETHGSLGDAPVLTNSDAAGRFSLASLRPDSRYYLFVEAPGHGGQFLQDIKAGQSDLKIAMGPELTVHGKVLHFAHILPNDAFNGTVIGGYSQSFKFGNNYSGSGRNIVLTPKNDEADFTISHLYAWPVQISFGTKDITLEAKDLPKTDLVVDLDSDSAQSGNH